ncbi:MAG: DUF4244 domain-containing protein [Streptosporangiales bacterium]|nr:DUF4244 domain-containing protein [Streptosporangiales bacterium]
MPPGAGSDDGMTTAEYVVGCVATVGFGTCLVKVLTSQRVYQLLDQIVREGWLIMQVTP